MPGDGAAGAGDGVVRDSRFKTLHNDPRFMNFPAATNKTKIDGRFAKMFSDPNFGTGARGNRDKRGRRTDKAKRKSAADDLKQYYDLEEEEGEEGRVTLRSQTTHQIPTMPPPTPRNPRLIWTSASRRLAIACAALTSPTRPTRIPSPTRTRTRTDSQTRKKA
jgi:hypothetical protein